MIIDYEIEKRRQEIDTEIAGLREEQARADRDRKVELWIADRLEAIAADIRNREACVHSLEIDSGRSTVMVNGRMAGYTRGEYHTKVRVESCSGEVRLEARGRP